MQDLKYSTRGVLAAVFLAAFALTGCAVHPAPEDFSHVPTPTIVRQIRCETRKAAIDSLFRYLTSRDNLRYNRLDERSLALGLEAKEAYEQDPDTFSTFDPDKLTGFARSVVGLLYSTGVAYNYDLIGVENNNLGMSANLIRPVPLASLVTLGASANFDRQRSSEETFTVTDNFGNLIRKVRNDYCTRSIVEENYIYPITGRIGVDKSVRKFLTMSLFENLSGDGKDVTAVKGPPTLVSQLQFQTAMGGGATPKITFVPLGGDFQVADVSLPLTVSRKDTHMVTIGLFLDKDASKRIAAIRTGIFSGTLITASGGASERGAAQAVEQFLTQRIFRPTITINQ